MSDLPTCLRAAMECVLSIPATLNMRRYRVFVTKIEYDGLRPGLGARTRTDTELLVKDGYIPVQDLFDKDVFLSGGLLNEKTLRLTVVPPYTIDEVTYGVSRDIYDPDVTDDTNTQIYFHLFSDEYPNGRYYKRKKVLDEKLVTYIYIEATGEVL